MTTSQHDEHYCHFAASAMLVQVRALVDEMPGVQQGEDIEHIHRMRVATRRLRTILGIFDDCFPSKQVAGWQRQVRRLTRALGEARDADVQIDFIERFTETLPEANYHPGLSRLLLRRKQARARQQNDVLNALEQINVSGVIEEMETTLRHAHARAHLHAQAGFAPRLYATADRFITTHLSEMMGYEIYLNDAARKKELHAMRIAAKHLRYAMNVFAPIFDSALDAATKVVRTIQDQLGEIHDNDVWIEALPHFMEEEHRRAVEYTGSARGVRRLQPGIDYLLQQQEAQRDQRFTEFQQFWKSRRETWPQLVQTVREHLPQAGDGGEREKGSGGEREKGRSGARGRVKGPGCLLFSGCHLPPNPFPPGRKVSFSIINP